MAWAARAPSACETDIGIPCAEAAPPPPARTNTITANIAVTCELRSPILRSPRAEFFIASQEWRKGIMQPEALEELLYANHRNLTPLDRMCARSQMLTLRLIVLF